MATRNEIEQIKDRLNIVDVVGRYVTLKKAGTNLRALCPFHNEKTPSFMVNPELNIFKCFGCGESGDVFAFVQKIEGLEFGEALEQLAGQAGVALTNDIKAPSTGKIKERELFTDLNSFVAGLYEYLLWQSPVGEPARAYLRERGIGEAIAKQFRLGYVPDRWDTVVKTLAEKGYTLSTAEKLGLVIRSDRQDGYYDRFRDRLMFPIFDPQDKVVGFSGRTLKKEFEGGKYINSPDSDIYHKGQILYAYNFAKHQARLSEELILVEGNLDVIQLHQAGEQNVVAPLGTALTSEQMKLAKRFVTKLLVAFDTDSAGAKATLNALELAENDGMDARVVRLVGAKDPDEAVKQDIKIWQDAKAKAVPVMTYRLQSILSAHDLTSSLGKQQSAKEALTLIARLESEVSRMHYLQQLGEALKVSQDTLQVELQRLKIIPSRARPVANIDTGDIPKLPAIEKEFMTLVVQNPTLIKALSQLNLNWISSPEIRHILEELMRQDANSFQFEAFYANVGTTEQKILAEAVFVPLQLDFAPEVVFAKLHDRLEYGYIKDRLTAIPKDIARAEIADDEATIVALQHEQQQLTVRREQLELDRI